LVALEKELRAAHLPYRAENSSIVYASQEIRELLLALRAADDPTDELALVSALRSPLYGCSDVELWDWKRAGGTWGLWRTPPDGFEDHPVADGIAHIRSLNARITTTGVADLLADLAEERRGFDVALDRVDARDVWHRLRFVIDQARAWADAGGRGPRRYLDWAHRQASEGQISEAILPEDDRDAVRLMTVHAAKGLEFPITLVSGLTTQPKRRWGIGVTWEGDGWQLTGKGDDGSFAEIAPLDELMSDAERRRLLYVACTRAVDHLVVSLHRARTDDTVREAEGDKTTAAELLWLSGATETTAVAASRAFEPHPLGTAPATTQAEPDDIAVWRDELNDTLSRAGRRHAIAATRLADEVMDLGRKEEVDDAGLDKHPVNIDLPPWQRGRYGTSIGRAVHGTLQFCDLASGSDIETLARSQCAAEGILGLTERVAALARSAILAPIVRQVVDGAAHWRELFVAAPIGDRVLEGYVDLLVRTPEGLVIVDYKTDQWSGPAQAAERIGRYRIQLAAYGAALQVALGEPVVRGILVRCRAGEAAEQIAIEEWQAAVSEVVRLVG
jgi:ATP-dependent helicase/nuclease subunit A